MKYPKVIQDVLDAVCPLIEEAGATYEYRHEKRSRHPKLFISFQGQTRMTPLASTPSIPRDSLHLKRRDVRRILRELGATT